MNGKETALVVGAGTGLGWALVRCFAGAGMAVAAALRAPDKLSELIDGLDGGLDGGVRAYACDATDEGAVGELFKTVAEDLGEPGLVVYNASAFVKKGLLETTAAELERCWRVGCLGGFMVGQAAARIMVAKGGGTILFTGATASLRGSAGFHNMAIPKFGLRALAQSMAREFGPRGIHVAHVIIDGQIMSDARADLAKERPPDGLLDADAIAGNYLHLHRQHRSAWTQELDLRPWVEKF
ncbi:MAG: SDR family NAD(P)-dependent oxidoreductase [Proteobacteria bacterium]|nr:SDR family NAD(P)-dependent oxidoreductase [Pseudomonadota bacterium]